MIMIALSLSLAEAVVLVGVVVTMLRMRTRMLSLTNRADGALAQMRDWVAEAEELSATLADRLNERPRRSTEKVERAPVAAQSRVPVAPVLKFKSSEPAASNLEPETDEDVDQLLVRRVAARRAEEPRQDRSVAHETTMDPAGVALQRLLWSQDAKGSA
jgi:hypothetical protein